MSLSGVTDEFEALDASVLVEEFRQWHGHRWKNLANGQYSNNPQGVEYESDSEDTKVSLWPQFVNYWKKKNAGCDLDKDKMIWTEGFKLWLLRRKQRKRERERYNVTKLCGKCGKNFRFQNFSKHEERCEFIQARQVICKENHEHQLINETFDTLDEAIAFFYDNEYDSEFCRLVNGQIRIMTRVTS